MEEGRRKREEGRCLRWKTEEGRRKIFPSPQSALLFFYSFFSSTFNVLHLVTKILTNSSQSAYND